MTPEQLKEIEDRANAASPSPWVYFPRLREVDTGSDGVGFDFQSIGSVEPELYEMSHEDGQFIANARQDIPALIAEVARLRIALKDVLDYYQDSYWNRFGERSDEPPIVAAEELLGKK